MTKRILAGFLAVLIALLVLVVVPLGVKISAQQRDDFHSTALAQAHALATGEEERLGDTSDPADAYRAKTPPVAAGDGVVVLGRDGEVLVRAGRPVPDDVVASARRGAASHLSDAETVLAPIGPSNAPVGTVVLVRDAEPLDHRVHALWLALTLAACVTIAFGAVIAAGLARWIARPLHRLESAATRVGQGDVSARAVVGTGPPEVRAVGTAFDEMAERIAALLANQRAMTADVSHQLRTPLAALQLRLELLADDAPESVGSELLDALREIARLNRLLDGLLAVARAEETTGERAVIDVATVIDERVQMWRPVAEDAGVALAARLEPASARLTTGHLEQVLDNVLANAVDALPPGGHVTVSTKALTGQVVVVVADDGPGMSPAQRLNALQRFEGDAAGRKAGLGLAIVARLVATDHGSVILDETPGGGLTVLIRLPAAFALEARPARAPG